MSRKRPSIGYASDQAPREGMEVNLRATKPKQSVPISQAADFTPAREAYREMKSK
jgi:hypothetical protein